MFSMEHCCQKHGLWGHYRLLERLKRGRMSDRGTVERVSCVGLYGMWRDAEECVEICS